MTRLLLVALALLRPGLPVIFQGPAPSPELFAYDQAAPLDVRVHARSAGDGYTRVDLDYASPATGRVPAFLFEPAEPAGAPAPAILMLHGVPGNRGSLSNLATAYARAGVYVLAITGPWARGQPYRATQFLVPAPLFDEHDRAELIQVVQELRRAVDYLRSRPKIDRSRIGFVGHSAGAMTGALLASVESRVRAFVLMAPTSGWVTWLRSHRESMLVGSYDELTEAEQHAWTRSLEPLEATRWIAAARGKLLLFQGGTADRTVAREDLLALYGAAAQPKILRWYEGLPHALGQPAFADQARFLGDHLGFDAARFVAPAAL
jgi:dienelactone hydrolase